MKAAARKRLKRKITSRTLDLFLNERNRVMNYKQVASRLGEKDNQIKLLITEALKDLAKSGKLLIVEKGKYRLANVSEEGVEGTISFNRRGKAFFSCEAFPDGIKVKAKKSVHILNNDVVLATLEKTGREDVALITEILEREERYFSGILEVTKNYAFLHPDDPFIHVDLFIPQGKLNGAKDGMKVAARIIDWPQTADSPFGEVIEVLGKPGEPNTEMESILYEFGLPIRFPEEVQQAADRIPLEMSDEDIKSRTDIRGVTTFTIDPDDAKDFDDALSLEKGNDGYWKVGVHIADVSHYIKEGSALDKEAIKRATSVYLADRVVPMLPEVLSNVLCSLRPKEDKLSFSVVLKMDDNAHVKEYQILRTVIHSDHRFTYAEAQKAIKTGTGPYAEEIKVLDGLAKKLRKQRMDSGSFNFHSDELKFKYDDKGLPVEVFKKQLQDSNHLVEEFMLLANKKVAQKVASYKPKPTFIYRNHDSPDVDRIVSLAQFVKTLGFSFDPSSRDIRQEINNLLVQVKDSEEEQLIQQMVIRSMAKADYGANNIGHYGLAFDDYSHFTSPIRRYPDVIAHRLIWKYLNGKSGPKTNSVEVLAKHCSLRERKAVEAERASLKFMQAVYMTRFIGKRFTGRISGVTSFGVFVVLHDNHCEGLVPINTMDDDHYVFKPEKNSLVGLNHGDEYRLGDDVEIKVISAVPLSRQVDFHLV